MKISNNDFRTSLFNYDSRISNNNFRDGFTLVEILVIVGIMVILIALAIPSYRFFQQESDLVNNTEEIINTLRLAQNKTLASERASQYGVYFDQSTSPQQYTLFKGSNYASRDISFDEVRKLSKSIEISEINFNGGGSEVIFDRISGTTSQHGYISIRLKDNPAKTKTVYIANSGKVELTSPSTPSDTERIKDSRHVHFNYNQNVQNAVTLRLVFPDYLSDNYDIPFQNYLNADKTEFSWEGIVSVGPDGSKTEQRLKIHTHSLTVMATQFCIHRPLSPDQSYNDKALNILLDTEELIKYASDAKGTTTKGSSIWIEEPELQ